MNTCTSHMPPEACRFCKAGRKCTFKGKCRYKGTGTHAKSATYIAQQLRQAHAVDTRRSEAEVALRLYRVWRNETTSPLPFSKWLEAVIAGEAV